MNYSFFNKSSVATKLALFISLVTGFVVLALGISNQRFLHEIGLELGGEQAEKALEMLDPYVQNGFDTLHTDLGVLVGAHAIQGIIRAEKNEGYDPVEGIALEAWRNRLRATLSLVMSARPDYTQISYIAATPEGRELVRVDRSEVSASPSAASKFDDISNNEVFRTALSMREGEFAFINSNNINYEEQVEANKPPVISAVTPVFDSDGVLYGILVITGGFRSIASSALNRFPWDWSVALLDEQGNLITATTANTTENSSAPGTLDSEFIGDSRSSSTEIQSAIDENNEVLTFYRDVTIGVSPYEKKFQIRAQVPVDELVTQSTLMTQRNLMIAVIILVTVMTLSFIFSSRAVAPLLSLDRAIRSFGKSNSKVRLPVDRNDEIGQIAKSFSSLSEKLQHTQTAERRTHQKLQAVFEQSIDSLVTINSTGDIESVNQAAIDLFGYQAEEVIGQNVKILMPEPFRSNHDQYIKNYRDTKKAKIIGSTREVQGLTKDGRKLDLELSISEIQFENQFVAYCGLLRDISERKAAEDKLNEFANELGRANEEYKQVNTELDLANEDLRTFTYIVSHDLRAPLVNLQGFTAQLEDSMEKILKEFNERSPESLPEDITNLINVRVPKATAFIASSTTKMQTNLDAILQVSRLGRFELSPTPVKLKDIFDSIFEAHLGDDWQDYVSMDLNSLPPLMIDEKAFRIIATNICSNAIKYKDPDRDLRLTVRADLTNSDFTLQVQDNGRGIDSKDLNKVFELFRRCGRSDTVGEGVGLTYTKTLVSRIGGSIWCESTVGEGTSFFVSIPIENCRPALEAA